MQARQAGAEHLVPESPAAPAVDPVALDFETAGGAPTRRPTTTAGPARARRRTAGPVAKPLSRGEEYAYIRGDMRRLLTIAGALLAVMLVLLVFIER